MIHSLIQRTALILACMLSLVSRIQAQRSVEIKEAFLNAINHERTEAFRQLFSPPMLDRNPTHQLRDKLGRIRNIGGLIETMELDKAVANTFTYRCKLEKMLTLQVVFDTNDQGMLSKMSISNYVYKEAPKLERNISPYALPFKGEWYVFWGGKTTRENYHNAYPGMRGAYDFWMMGRNGKSSPGNPKRNEDFYAFGKEIIAPVDAKVIYTINHIEDNTWPAMNRAAGGGNIVLLETDQKEYILLAHLKKGSIVVKKGDSVKQGQLLGLCGNSGNSTEPHLHFQTQNLPDLAAASGAWTHFEKITVNGMSRTDYIPKRGDKISN